MPTKPLYSNQDKEQFGLFYKQCAVDYMAEHKLGIEVDSLFFHNANFYCYKVMPISSLSEQKSNQFHHNSLEIKNKIICNEYPIQNIEWNNYLNDFFSYMYNKANSLQKTILQKETFLAHSLKNISEALSDNPKELIHFIDQSKEIYSWMISTPWLVSSLVKTWYSIFEPNDFNHVMLDFFSFHKKQLEKPKNSINLHYLFENFVADNHTYQQLITFLPPKDKNASPFIDTDHQIYEVNINRNILTQHVSLNEKKHYTEMNTAILALFSLYGEDLKILDVSLRGTTKSTTEFNLVVRTTADCTYNKEKFQTILMGLFEGYANLSIGCSYSWQIPPLMTKEWFINNIFSTIVPDNNKIVKKNKI